MVKEVEEDLNRAIKVINKYSFVDGNLTLFWQNVMSVHGG
jgi:hypothetical protein